MNECYVIHATPWKETSLIVEVLTAADGRVSLLAKGARRPRSVHRGLLQPFHRLNIRYSRRGDLKTLISAEWDGGSNIPIIGQRLLSGFYVNELILKLLQKNETCPRLFEAYEKTIISLADTLIPAEVILRRFEIFLLLHMGVLPDFKSVLNKIDEKKIYFITFKDGIKVLDGQNPSIIKKEIQKYLNLHNEKVVIDQFVSLRTVQAIASYDSSIENFFSMLTIRKTAIETKKLLRSLIRYQLGSVNLRSRKLMLDLTNFTRLKIEGYLDD